MDLNMRSELPKPGTDSRLLVENQRLRLEGIRKENEEFEQRAKFLHSKINEYQEVLFKNQMGEKIKELVRENLKLSVDAQCLSIQLDIFNQGVENQGMIDNRQSPGTSAQHQGHPPHSIVGNYQMGGSPGSHMGNSPVSPMHSGVIRGSTPTSNVVTLDTSSYPYAHVMTPPNPMSPYPVQPQVGYPMNNNRPNHLSPRHETSRQVSPVHPGTPLYTYDRQTGQTINILSQVPPPVPNSWGHQMANYPISPMMQMPSPPGQQMQHGPPLPPRPTDLPIARGRDGRSGIPTPPHRAPPPPPTPPKPSSRSPNLDRSRSSNEMLDNHSERSNGRPWQCAKCTFENHEDINECEMCQNPRHGSVGNIYTSLAPLHTETKDQRPHSSKRHHKSKKRSDRSPQ